MTSKENQYCRVMNKPEWLATGFWTEVQLDSVKDNGFIGTKYGIDCYLSTMVPVSQIKATRP